MMTFGYKEKFNGVARAVLAIAIGIVMVWIKANALNIALQIIGALIAARGVLGFFVNLFDKDNPGLARPVVSMVIGGFLYFMPDLFVNLVVYIIAVVLIILAVIQLLAMGSASRVIHLGCMPIVLPLLVVVLGVLLLVRPAFIGETIGLLAGISLIVYGISELLSSWKMNKAIHEYDIKFPNDKSEQKDNSESQTIKDVDYEKVDEQ